MIKHNGFTFMGAVIVMCMLNMSIATPKLQLDSLKNQIVPGRGFCSCRIVCTVNALNHRVKRCVFSHCVPVKRRGGAVGATGFCTVFQGLAVRMPSGCVN